MHGNFADADDCRQTIAPVIMSVCLFEKKTEIFFPPIMNQLQKLASDSGSISSIDVTNEPGYLVYLSILFVCVVLTNNTDLDGLFDGRAVMLDTEHIAYQESSEPGLISSFF